MSESGVTMQDTYRTFKALLALKGVMCAVERADRLVWAKVMLTYYASLSILIVNGIYMALFVKSQPIQNIAANLTVFLMYLCFMIGLSIAGSFVLKCRNLIPTLTHMSFIWPQSSPTQAKAQLLILELIDRISNRQRGIGFTFGHLTPPLTKLATVKVTLGLAHRFILLLKKMGH